MPLIGAVCFSLYDQALLSISTPPPTSLFMPQNRPIQKDIPSVCDSWPRSLQCSVTASIHFTAAIPSQHGACWALRAHTQRVWFLCPVSEANVKKGLVLLPRGTLTFQNHNVGALLVWSLSQREGRQFTNQFKFLSRPGPAPHLFSQAPRKLKMMNVLKPIGFSLWKSQVSTSNGSN